ncbi:hypothetical protein CSOJ01_07451 [Colletotrichum sojae]|uniref:Uncharacterized protein n=1 Tax=Colletotrichum sojae TaxID=2175907 RepID=A0A8H6J9P7_9PEZI|nr:hypothetical protein CSOJ01_07451 [Colletotrichum sojae]
MRISDTASECSDDQPKREEFWETSFRKHKTVYSNYLGIGLDIDNGIDLGRLGRFAPVDDELNCDTKGRRHPTHLDEAPPTATLTYPYDWTVGFIRLLNGRGDSNTEQHSPPDDERIAKQGGQTELTLTEPESRFDGRRFVLAFSPFVHPPSPTEDRSPKARPTDTLQPGIV